MAKPTSRADEQVAVTYDEAVRELLDRTKENTWFSDTFWPENRDRARWIVEIIAGRFPPARDHRVLDVGCFNGFLVYLLGRMGYDVTGLDSFRAEDQAALFAAAEAVFQIANLNDPRSFREVPPESFDAIVLGQVFEHVLNEPLGLLKTMRSLLRPGGIVVLDTPNPATLANAIRLLRNRYMPLGAYLFTSEAKIKDGEITSNGGIHYHEYLSHELAGVVAAAGLTIEMHEFFAMGSPKGEAYVKRLIKGARIFRPLFRTRLFGSNQLVVAVRA